MWVHRWTRPREMIWAQIILWYLLFLLFKNSSGELTAWNEEYWLNFRFKQLAFRTITMDGPRYRSLSGLPKHLSKFYDAIITLEFRDFVRRFWLKFTIRNYAYRNCWCNPCVCLVYKFDKRLLVRLLIVCVLVSACLCVCVLMFFDKFDLCTLLPRHSCVYVFCLWDWRE